MLPRGLLLAVLLSATSPGFSPGSGPAAEGDLLDRFAGRVQDAAQSGSPFLFRVIRSGPEGEGPASPRILGSGIAIGSGRILTTAGVVGPAREVLVCRSGGDTLRARVLGVDRRTDLALVEAAGLDFPPMPIAEGSLRFPGEAVVALGLGPRAAPTASFGVVVLDAGPRLGLTETDVLQVSAPAFPGLTGGPLVNLEGELVGVVSGRMVLDPASAVLPAGVSLVAGYLDGGTLTSMTPSSALIAIPAAHALDLARELGDRGRIQRGYLGLQVELVQAKEARVRRFPGVRVERVVPASPAAAAGLLPGDLILEYAGIKVQRPETLSGLVAATVPDSDVVLKYLRRGVTTTSVVRITQAPEPAWNPAFDEAIPSAALPAGVAPAVH